MIKKALHAIALVFCFLAIPAVSACSDGIFSLRGYIPEENSEDEQAPPPPQTAPPETQKTDIPDFILKILNEKDVPAPKQELPSPPPHTPQKQETDPLDAS